MIFIEKNGRFGNFLFQFFFAKSIQKKNNHKIVVFSKNENIYDFNSKENIDSIVSGYYSLPKFSKFLNLWKKRCFYINDENYKEVISRAEIYKAKFIYINGFFQDMSIIDANVEILSEIINYKKNIFANNFSSADLTIHIRHLHHELGSLDTNPNHQDQPEINYYMKIISDLKPKKIKVICSNQNNYNYLKLKDVYKNNVYLETRDDVFDFFNLMNSENIILSNSSYSLWASLLSNAKNIYVPNLGILKKIFNKKKLNLNKTFIYN